MVLQEWLKNLTFKEQTVLLCSLRGPDSGGSFEIKAWIRKIRRIVLNNAAPKKTFMQEEFVKSFKEIADTIPLILDMLPVHFLGHLMHSIEIIGYKHPDDKVRSEFQEAYFNLCEYLHINPESEEQMTERLKDEI